VNARHRLTAAALLLVVMAAAPAVAQESQARVYVSADGLYQALFDPFSKRSTFDLFQEAGTFTAVYPANREPAVGGTVVVRVWRWIALGAGVTRMRSRTDATVEGEIPHPFFFDQDRHVEGGVDVIEREEVGVHLQFRMVVPVTRRIDLSVFAGPSRWRIRQDRITSIDYVSQYPFDTAQLSGVTVEKIAGHTWGYNAGVDLGLYLTRHIGVGGLLMLATANPEAAATATTADTRIGGLRAGGGLRIRF
jgi:hypothetical protein